MPLVHRAVTPVKVSGGKLELRGKYECEFVAVNNETLVNVLRQLASVVSHAADIFSETAALADKVGRRIKNVKLRLEELEAKSELFDPKLVPVPEGSLDDVSISEKFSMKVVLETRLFDSATRPRFLLELFDKAGSHCPSFPPRSPVTTLTRKSAERLLTPDSNRRPASFAALRDWKLDDYLDEKIKTLDKKKQSADELNRALAAPFPSQLVQVDVTGQGFDRMKRNRRSLVIHTKRIRRSKRRNTICGSMPNKECGIQTSFSSVNSPSDENNEKSKKYGIDSGHWSSSCTDSGQNCAQSITSTAPSPWDPTTVSLSTSSDFLFDDDEDRCLTPQLEHFTDGMVSDSDSVDTDGYFTSFRSDCGFPKSKKSQPDGDLKEEDEEEEKDPATTIGTNNNSTSESEYDLFGKGSTSTTASSCGTVVMRSKPNPPTRNILSNNTSESNNFNSQSDDLEWEERLKRKSLIERVPSLVVVTPSPSCSSGSPPPLKDPGLSSAEDSDRDSGRITPKAEDLLQTTGSECETLSDVDTDSELALLRPPSNASSSGTVSSGNSTLTLTASAPSETKILSASLPQPDVIPDVQLIRTKATGPKLDVSQEYFSLDTVLGDQKGAKKEEANKVKEEQSRVTSPQNTSGKVRGARVVLDANGEIIFASETLRRKRKPKVSFDPGPAVKTMDYDSCGGTYGRIRESVYDRIKKDHNENDEKLYDCIEEIRKQNLKHPYLHLQEEKSIAELCASREKEEFLTSTMRSINGDSDRCSSSASSNTSSIRSRVASRPPLSPPTANGTDTNTLLETDLDSPIPPSMPDLKNLPKIKDRLKRNESYRIANTDEKTGGGNKKETTADNSRPVLLPLTPLNNRINRRMSFASKGGESGNLHLNKKRDILEEDPIFIQQILNVNKSPLNNSSGLPHQQNTIYSSRITLSKFALSPEDRPTFLRRESPPTMDEIAKEIYRFRKKFNIQPNTPSRNLLPPMLKTPPMSGVVKSPQSNSTRTPGLGTKSPHQNSTIPSGFPKLEVQQPQMSSNSAILRSPYYNNKAATPTNATPPPPPTRTSASSSRRKIFPTNTSSPITTSGALKPSELSSSNDSFASSILFSYNRRNSFAECSGTSSPSFSSSALFSPGARTSLSDFKKLLQAAKPKRSSISAMEVLKPKVGVESPN